MDIFWFSITSVLTFCFIQDDVAGCFEYFADVAEKLDSKQSTPVALPMEAFKCHVVKEPIGVVGLITPWYVLLLIDEFYFFFSE